MRPQIHIYKEDTEKVIIEKTYVSKTEQVIYELKFHIYKSNDDNTFIKFCDNLNNIDLSKEDFINLMNMDLSKVKKIYNNLEEIKRLNSDDR